VWGDKDIKMKLLRKGVLTRIYAPMVSMILLPKIWLFFFGGGGWDLFGFD
jgi:hypothetical protein